MLGLVIFLGSCFLLILGVAFVAYYLAAELQRPALVADVAEELRSAGARRGASARSLPRSSSMWRHASDGDANARAPSPIISHAQSLDA
jgi:hypothetical protein